MARITTVCGDIAPDELGITDMHEHLLFDMSAMQGAIKATLPPIPDDKWALKPANIRFRQNEGMFYADDIYHAIDIPFAVEEVEAFKVLGGKSVVEAGPTNIRHDIEDLRTVSRETGVNIICSTGFGMHFAMGAYDEASTLDLYTIMADEVQNGIQGTDIRPGIVKFFLHLSAGQDDFYPAELHALEASAQLASETGMEIQIHTFPLSSVDQLVQVANLCIEKYGIDPRKVHFAHLDTHMVIDAKEFALDETIVRRFGYEKPLALLDLGCSIGFDTWSNPSYNPGVIHYDDYDRLRLLVQLLKRGYEDQIVLGHDMIPKLSGVGAGGAGMTRVLSFVVPMLRECGFGDEVIGKLLVENPKYLLSY